MHRPIHTFDRLQFFAIVGSDQIIPLRDTLATIECREINRALQVSQGNKSQAARSLKISYPNLLKKIRHYGIVPN